MTKSTKIIAALGVAAGLGIAALPAGAIFAQTTIPLNYDGDHTSADVTVQLTVGEAIALAVDSNICSATTQINSTESCSHKVAAGSNAASGFKIQVADADATLDLTSDDTSSSITGKIAAVDGALTAGMNGGGWNISGGLLTQKAIKVAEQTVYTTAAPGETEVQMTYNFATQAAQEAGTYSDVITYTASTN